ncbi:hypothetical protein [Halopelagius longus]|uniref:Uncharacterized protein n=1 Tax=Halopelagius longus TaxID=1236180 RepID=A0A1H1B496_9EURY|nr:hypothetical protein [Halopelagius longus]RDI70629.1 hypothetical protein DWB78_02205 [Halopelagius longus]SDQ46601.1 hypothetical protein SAMN05216278_1624 [Halopelagius longus]
MGRSIDISGGWLSRILYAFQLVALLLALFFVVPSLGDAAGALLGLLFALLVVAIVIGARRSADGDGGNHLGTAEDITYDPFGDPGQAARERWEKAVRRLPGGDDERD